MRTTAAALISVASILGAISVWPPIMWIVGVVPVDPRNPARLDMVFLAVVVGPLLLALILGVVGLFLWRRAPHVAAGGGHVSQRRNTLRARLTAVALFVIAIPVGGFGGVGLSEEVITEGYPWDVAEFIAICLLPVLFALLLGIFAGGLWCESWPLKVTGALGLAIVLTLFVPCAFWAGGGGLGGLIALAANAVAVPLAGASWGLVYSLLRTSIAGESAALLGGDGVPVLRLPNDNAAVMDNPGGEKVGVKEKVSGTFSCDGSLSSDKNQ